jgi:hypothetical protein
MLPLALLAAVLAAAPAPAVPSAAGAPSLAGVTAWMGVSGTLAEGAAIPLARWPSLFGKGSAGELAALVGKGATVETGLALGHCFPDVRVPLGTVAMGSCLGVGGVIPFSQPCAGKACRTGLRAARPVLFVTLPLSTTGGTR